MKKVNKIIGLTTVVILSMGILAGCGEATTDEIQQKQTEQIAQQAQAKVGLPNIKNFYELSMAKTIMEACDDSNLITYAYEKSDYSGKLTYIGKAMGYGLPYGTEITNPEKAEYHSSSGYATLPQADPNMLYKAQNVSATWVMLIDPKDNKAKPVYIESEVTVSPFKLPRNLCDQTTLPADYDKQ